MCELIQLRGYPVGATSWEVKDGPEDGVLVTTDLFYFQDWPHLHSSDMIMSMGDAVAPLLQTRESIKRVLGIDFSHLATSNLQLLARRNPQHLTPKALRELGILGKVMLKGQFETSNGDTITLTGTSVPNPIRANVNINPHADELAGKFNEGTKTGKMFEFPLSGNKDTSCEDYYGDKCLFHGLSVAHELLMKAWQHHLPPELLPNDGFARSVSYTSVPSLRDLHSCDSLVMIAGNWNGVELTEDINKVEIRFGFKRDGSVVCRGLYQHLHPRTPESHQKILADAGIIS